MSGLTKLGSKICVNYTFLVDLTKLESRKLQKSIKIWVLNIFHLIDKAKISRSVKIFFKNNHRSQTYKSNFRTEAIKNTYSWLLNLKISTLQTIPKRIKYNTKNTNQKQLPKFNKKTQTKIPRNTTLSNLSKNPQNPIKRFKSPQHLNYSIARRKKKK